MTSSYVIRAHNLSKRYKVGRRQRYRMFRDIVLDGAKTVFSLPTRMLGRRTVAEDTNTLWALKDVNFDIMPGDSVGIIGNNGAGKSTLLKILSRITVPTTGFAHLRGRVGSLLEVGTGFHPELTGRENIYLNGAILGMRKTEIDRKFDEIVAFSEVESFLDTPVKFYSSGMRVRLAFSVAAHLEPEILLVDEVLAVGDIAFQKKSISRMEQVANEGRTVLFVSHNLVAVRALCKRGIFLERGRVSYIGDVEDAVKTYLDAGAVKQHEESSVYIEPNPAQPLQILSIAILSANSESVSVIPYEMPFFVEIGFSVRKAETRTFLALDVLDEANDVVLSSFDFESERSFINYDAKDYKIRVRMPPILVPGKYSLSLRVIRKGRRKDHLADAVYDACRFEVADSGSARTQAGLKWSGKITTSLEWTISPLES